MNELLIISVGGNPTPCYFVAKAMLTSNQNINIIFLCTFESELYALSLCEVLKKEFLNIKIESLLIEGSGKKMDFLPSSLQKKIKDYKKIHFDFTSGTKTVSVILSMYLTNLKSNKEIILSNINPDEMKLECYNYSKEGKFFDEIDLKKYNLFKDIKTVCDIHFLNYEKKETNLNQSGFKFEAEIEKILKENFNFKEVLSNIVFKKQGENSSKDGFEVDIVAVTNYRIFAISISESNNSSNNEEKIYEIYYRSSQIGGEFCKKIALLKGLEEKTAIKFNNELNRYTHNHQLLCVGKNVLSDLNISKKKFLDELKVCFNELKDISIEDKNEL